jgi:hypothetical protein
MTKGEKTKAFMDEQGIGEYMVLASTPGEDGGGFHLAVGEAEMLVSLFTMFFRAYPELYIMLTGTIVKIMAAVSDEQLAENQARVAKMAGECDCENCKKRKERGKDGVDLNDFIAKGNLN